MGSAAEGLSTPRPSLCGWEHCNLGHPELGKPQTPAESWGDLCDLGPPLGKLRGTACCLGQSRGGGKRKWKWWSSRGCSFTNTPRNKGTQCWDRLSELWNIVHSFEQSREYLIKKKVADGGRTPWCLEPVLPSPFRIPTSLGWGPDSAGSSTGLAPWDCVGHC